MFELVGHRAGEVGFVNRPFGRRVRRLALGFLALLVLLLSAGRAQAADVPFSAGHIIDADFTGARAAHTADMDGDGDLDVVGAAFYIGLGSVPDIAWWENLNGAGTSWTAHTISANFSGATSVCAADMDGDGDVDVLATRGSNSIDPDIGWWENLNGAGTSWTEHKIDVDADDGVGAAYPVDLDGDGDLDVVGSAFDVHGVKWWENLNGAGTSWTEHSIDANFLNAWPVHAADVDGDGDLDVLGAAFSAQAIAWWENLTGAGTSWTRHIVSVDFDFPRSVDAADVDGDGDLDVLGASQEADDITWWENLDGTGTSWSTHTIDGDFNFAVSVKAGDVDGDGDLDVLGAGGVDAGVKWWENLNGAGTSWTTHILDLEWTSSVHAGDVDGDGDLDVLGAGEVEPGVTWWENETIHRNGVFPAEHTISGAFDGAVSVGAADLDGDGDLDVLGAAQNADEIAWWENLNGAGTSWTEHTIDGAFDGAYSLDAADVDGDGDLDVLGAAQNADEIAWWENLTGAGTTWTTHTIDGDFDGAHSVHAADLDGDGDLDVLGAGYEADDITWWENLNGPGTSWATHTIDGSFDGAISVHAADLDGDGDLDVLAGAWYVDDITWWENLNGAGTSWTAHTIDGPVFDAPWVDAADLDGDGDLDALWAAFRTDDITWWENRGGQFALPTTSLATSPLTLPVEPAVLQIDAVHNGRTSDTDVELVSFELLFDDGIAPLTTAQANDAIENLRVYRDDGSGVFEPVSDFLAVTVSTLSLSAGGVQQVSFVDGNTDAQVVFGSPQTYFVVLELVSAGLVNMLRATHLTESSSTGEDRDHDIPLKLEFALNTPTPMMVLEAGPGADCPADLVRANQILSGTQTLKATATATLGPNLIVDGADIAVNAPTVSIFGDTEISGIFSLGANPACP